MSGARPIPPNKHIDIQDHLTSLRDKCLYVLGHSTGFRITELLSIKVKDVLNGDHVKVERKHTKGQTQSREMLITKAAKHAITEYLTEAHLDPGHYLFRSRKGVNEPISRVQAYRILKSAFIKSGLEGSYSTHSMRKSYAVNIYKKSNHDIVLTQKLLGHTSILNTVKYLPVDEEALAALLKDE